MKLTINKKIYYKNIVKFKSIYKKIQIKIIHNKKIKLIILNLRIKLLKGGKIKNTKNKNKNFFKN